MHEHTSSPDRHLQDPHWPRIRVRVRVGSSRHPDPILQQEVDLEDAVSRHLVTMLKVGTAVRVAYLHPVLHHPISQAPSHILYTRIALTYPLITRQETQPHDLRVERSASVNGAGVYHHGRQR